MELSVIAPKSMGQKCSVSPYAESALAIQEMLGSFGLAKNEIKVYLHLAEAGPQKAKIICEEANIQRTETYRVLRHLEKKGLVFMLPKKPIMFSAVALNEAMDLLINAQKIRLRMLETQKDALVNVWASSPQKKYSVVERDFLHKIECKRQIIQKINDLLEKTRIELAVFVSDGNISELYFGGFFDNLMQYRELDITLLTEISQKSTYFLDKIKWPTEKRRMIPHPGVSSFMISDEKELLVILMEGDLSLESGHRKKVRNVALWTNHGALVGLWSFLFGKLQCVNH